MTELSSVNGLCCPLIALLTSTGVDSLAEKNGLLFADMLAPFCSAQINIKDPAGNYVNSKLFLDIRDIRRSGFLLSHTVLPYVIRENISLCLPSSNISDDVFTQTFANLFLYWFEPADHEFLRSYVCCMFVVSVGDEDPMQELNHLHYQQHLQQHGGNDCSNSLSLAHCSSPKWMLPNILKYYVLVQDASTQSDDRAKEIFLSMTKKYGPTCCHLLRTNSTNCSQLPNPWRKIIDQRYRGLQAGLERARRVIIEKSNSENAPKSDGQNQYIPTAQISRSSTTSSFLFVSGTTGTAPNNSLFTTSSTLPLIDIPPNFPASSCSASNGFGSVNSVKQENLNANTPESTNSTNNMLMMNLLIEHGQCLDAGDRERLKEFIEEFVKGALVPFVEHQLAVYNETLQNRRTIGRSLNSMRKWLSAASSASSLRSTASYGVESSEYQARCLADMAFQFGLYNFAYQLYQTLKKDFSNDQVWLYHAGALEMAALSNFLACVSANVPSASGSSALSAKLSSAVIAQLHKTYPQRYMDNAINYYLNVCLQPLLALRCVLISVAILSRIELYSEAANHLILLNTHNIPDLFGAVLLEHAACLFELSNKRRRMAFYLVLAGQRYAKSGLVQYALASYQRVLPLIQNKYWNFAEDHILYTLTMHHDYIVDNSKKVETARFATECAGRLLRHFSRQSADQQLSFLVDYIRLLKKYKAFVSPFNFSIPLIENNSIKVFYGDSLESSRSLYATTLSSSTTIEKIALNSIPPEDFMSNEGFDNISLVVGNSLVLWNELERIFLQVYNANLSNGANAEVSPFFSDNFTNNSGDVKISPLYEPITVQLELTNPLAIPLTLKNLSLGFNAQFEGQNVVSNPSSVKVDVLETLTLSPCFFEMPNDNSGKDVDAKPKSTVVDINPNDNGIFQQKALNSVVINLSITPSQPFDLIQISRLDFELFDPTFLVAGTINNETTECEHVQNRDGISGYIPLNVQGKRLFATKEQRRTPTYAKDNRLNVRVSSKQWPLMEFRIAGNAGGRVSGHHINAYCNQMYQVIVEVENVGNLPVTSLYLCSDQADLVSLSEEFKALFSDDSNVQPTPLRWQLCETAWKPATPAMSAMNSSKGVLVHKLASINASRLCTIGQKFLLRLAFRAPSYVIKNHQISVIFFYVGENGTTRQFRYRLALSTQPLLSTSLRLLNAKKGLCLLQLKNLVSTRDSILARIELQRFSSVLLALQPNKASNSNKKAKLPPFSIVNISNLQWPQIYNGVCSATPKLGVQIRPIINKNIILESDQSQNYCFYLCGESVPSHSQHTCQGELWLSDFVADIPVWSHLLPINEFLPQLADGVTSALSSVKVSKLKLNAEVTDEQMGSTFLKLNLNDDYKENNQSFRVLHLRFAVLWKAYITNNDGTVATVFGENFLPNPFISAEQELLSLPFYSMPGSSDVFIATNSEIKESQLYARMSKKKQNLRYESEASQQHGVSPTLMSSANTSFRSAPNPFISDISLTSPSNVSRLTPFM